MLVFEMHLQVNQRLQEIASFKRDKFKPQEIDIALNKAVYRLVQDSVEKRFQDDQINLSYISSLLEKNKIGTVIVPATNDPLYEDGLRPVYTVLPPDFYWLVNCRTEVVEDLHNCDTAPTLATQSLVEYRAVVAFPTPGVAPYFANTSVTSSILGTLYTSPSEISAGFANVNSKYIVVDNILERVTNSSVQVFWEDYRGVHYPNSFIFVGTVPIGNITMVSGGVTTGPITPTQTSYSTYNRGAIPNIPNGNTLYTSASNREQSALYDGLTNNKYYNTRKRQPVFTQTHDYLILYPEESFLITRTYYDYIRKPRTISLVLNQSCDLPETSHNKIIDLAVEILRLDIKDQAYGATVQDTELRTT